MAETLGGATAAAVAGPGIGLESAHGELFTRQAPAEIVNNYGIPSLCKYQELGYREA